MLSTKRTILDKIIKLLGDDLATIKRAADETHANSTSAESKAEGKYDTRGVEAAYLAGAQAEQVHKLDEAYAKLKALTPVDEPDTVLTGSLVVVTGDHIELNYFILPAGGGTTLEHDGEDYLVITPTSPIGAGLLGKELGATIEVPNQTNAYVSEIY